MRCLAPNELELESLIVAAPIECAATRKTGGCAAQSPRPCKTAPAIRARVKIPTRLTSNREGEIVTARFPGNSKIGAGPLPLRPVRRDPTSTSAKLREQMRQFMTQSAINLRLAMLAQTAIENNTHGAELSAASRGAKTA